MPSSSSELLKDKVSNILYGSSQSTPTCHHVYNLLLSKVWQHVEVQVDTSTFVLCQDLSHLLLFLHEPAHFPKFLKW